MLCDLLYSTAFCLRLAVIDHFFDWWEELEHFTNMRGLILLNAAQRNDTIAVENLLRRNGKLELLRESEVLPRVFVGAMMRQSEEVVELLKANLGCPYLTRSLWIISAADMKTKRLRQSPWDAVEQSLKVAIEQGNWAIVEVSLAQGLLDPAVNNSFRRRTLEKILSGGQFEVEALALLRILLEDKEWRELFTGHHTIAGKSQGIETHLLETAARMPGNEISRAEGGWRAFDLLLSIYTELRGKHCLVEKGLRLVDMAAQGANVTFVKCLLHHTGGLNAASWSTLLASESNHGFCRSDRVLQAMFEHTDFTRLSCGVVEEILRIRTGYSTRSQPRFKASSSTAKYILRDNGFILA